MRLPESIGTLDFGDWIHGLLAAIIGGGASAVSSGFVVTMKDPEHYQLMSANFFQLVGTVFVVAGVLNGMAYLRQKPVPDFKTTTVIEERSPHTSTITTVVQEVAKTPEVPKP